MAQEPIDGEHTVSEAIKIELANGATVIGRLWTRPSKRGSFEVEYSGRRKTDGRSDYIEIGRIRAIARIILREMAEQNR